MSAKIQTLTSFLNTLPSYIFKITAYDSNKNLIVIESYDNIL